MRASRNFKEASSREILLLGDDLAAVEAMLEFACCNDYTIEFSNAECWDERKLQFLRHIRVFAIADKYQAPVLQSLALAFIEASLRIMLDTCMDRGHILRFAVEETYFNHDNHFPTERHPPPKPSKPLAPANIVWGDEVDDGQGNDDLIDCEDSHDYDKDIVTQMFPEDDHSFFHYNLLETMSKDNPIERERALVVKLAIPLWLDGSNDDRQCLRVMVQKVPEFGTQLVVAALKTGSRKADPLREPILFRSRSRDYGDRSTMPYDGASEWGLG